MARIAGAIGAYLRRFAIVLAACAAAAVALAGIYAAVAHKPFAGSVTASLFICGAVVFVGAASEGGGSRGRRLDTIARRRVERPEMPFSAVFVGLALIGIGVLTLVL